MVLGLGMQGLGKLRVQDLVRVLGLVLVLGTFRVQDLVRVFGFSVQGFWVFRAQGCCTLRLAIALTANDWTKTLGYIGCILVLLDQITLRMCRQTSILAPMLRLEISEIGFRVWVEDEQDIRNWGSGLKMQTRGFTYQCLGIQLRFSSPWVAWAPANRQTARARRLASP